MKKIQIQIIVITIFTLGFSKLFSQQPSVFFSKADVFFNTYVIDGKVAYEKIKENPELFNELITLANKVEVSKSSSKQYQSFWINSYNLSVIKEVVRNYPIKSPLDVKGFFDTKKHEISGEKITLNDIENKKLREQFNNDPRFHFVLVCAGLGCPPIVAEAYTPENLEEQLDRQTTIALNDDNFIRINLKKRKVELSQIFEWYTSDFTRNGKTLINFINKYRTNKISDKVKTSFYEYNWNLNITK